MFRSVRTRFAIYFIEPTNWNLSRTKYRFTGLLERYMGSCWLVHRAVRPAGRITGVFTADESFGSRRCVRTRKYYRLDNSARRLFASIRKRVPSTLNEGRTRTTFLRIYRLRPINLRIKSVYWRGILVLLFDTGVNETFFFYEISENTNFRKIIV